MIPPVRTTPPASPVVSVASLRAQLRMDPNDTSQDALLTDLEAEAVARLDGYRGLLGRGILAQTWQQEFTRAGVYRLALPDVVTIMAEQYVDSAWVAATIEAEADALGMCVVIPAVPMRVTYQVVLPVEILAGVKSAIKLHVAYFYDHGGDGDPKAYEQFIRAFNGQIDHLRWVAP